MAKAIMIQGTMSNAGKSLLAAGLCRIFAQDGYRTAPFKSQNMALNSFITREGLEMGRAQVVQAEAAGIAPSADMNPILLKPTTDVGSQVIVNGISRGNMEAKDYFAYKSSLIPDILAAYRRLEACFDIIVIEGAGSPAEINLKADDIVNMGLAELVNAPVLLAGDIDRGGVFAQLYGTMALLEQTERARVKGLIVNKFRGDPSILTPGLKQLEELCNVPVLGVVPYMDVDMEDEDSLSDKLTKVGEHAPGLIDLAVIRFPRISNFTDFDVFSCIKGVTVRYVSRLSELKTPDMVFLPGTKSTIDDLLWLRQSGLEAAVLKLADRQTPVWGICGGYQMLGEELIDRCGVESEANRQVKGLGLLPLRTEFEEEKVRSQAEGAFGELDGCLEGLSGISITGYEIHMGRTVINREHGPMDTARLMDWRPEPEICRPMCYVMGQGEKRAREDGWNRGNVYGAYVHGIFDAPGVAEGLVRALAARKGIAMEEFVTGNYRAYRQRQYDKLADELRRSLNIPEIYRIMGLGRGEVELEQVLPAEIERRSFEIISQELAARDKRLPEGLAPIIMRAIHTTADFDYADNLVFSEGVVEESLAALRRGAVIVTDTNMAKSGINKRKLEALGGEAFCFMADDDVAQAAKEGGTTRAVASMEKAASLFGRQDRPCIFAIGNAPTALIRLCELTEAKAIAPALIIGAPVGFVNVVQSKELLMTRKDTTYIVARGRKGGSNVAAAICNALLYMT